MTGIVAHSGVEHHLSRRDAVDLVDQRFGRGQICEEVTGGHVDPSYPNVAARIILGSNCEDEVVFVSSHEILVGETGAGDDADDAAFDLEASSRGPQCSEFLGECNSQVEILDETTQMQIKLLLGESRYKIVIGPELAEGQFEAEKFRQLRGLTEVSLHGACISRRMAKIERQRPAS
jgi:hypothetical protein